MNKGVYSMNKTMEMYSPSHKKKVMAEVVEGYAQNSKGGTPRLALKGLFEGKKTLPKKVDVKTFEKYGFNAEQTIAAFHAESVGEPLPESPLEDAPSDTPSPVEPTNANFSGEEEGVCPSCGGETYISTWENCSECGKEWGAEDSPSPSGPSEEPEPAEATGSEPSNENFSAEYEEVMRDVEIRDELETSGYDAGDLNDMVEDLVIADGGEKEWLEAYGYDNWSEVNLSKEDAINVIVGLRMKQGYTVRQGCYFCGQDSCQNEETDDRSECENPDLDEGEYFWSDEGFGAESAFDKLEDEVAEEYEEKGMSDEEAERIGAAVAYKQGVKKYGKKIMTEAAKKGVSAKSLTKDADYGRIVGSGGKRCWDCGGVIPTAGDGPYDASILCDCETFNTDTALVEEPDWIPAGDGRALGQQNFGINMSPLHAEEPVRWERNEEAFEKMRRMARTPLHRCNDCGWEGDDAATASWKCPECNSETMSSPMRDREWEAESQHFEACGICDNEFNAETLNADGYCGSCCDTRLAEFNNRFDFSAEKDDEGRTAPNECPTCGEIDYMWVNNGSWDCDQCGCLVYDAENSKGVSKNAQIALGLTALGVGLALWKSDSIMNIIDGIKKLGE
jgi:ribosomal protein L37AE/L43A